MADSSRRGVTVKKKIGVCRVEPLNNETQEELANKTQEEFDKTQEKLAKDFNKGLEDIFLFDLLIK